MLSYVLDEQVRGWLWHAIQTHNSRGTELIDATQVGSPADLPLGTKDPEVLLWAEQDGRILVSRDRRSLTGHFADHLQAGRSSPGLFIVRRRTTLPQVVDFLAYAAYRSGPDEWRDRIEYIP